MLAADLILDRTIIVLISLAPFLKDYPTLSASSYRVS